MDKPDSIARQQIFDAISNFSNTDVRSVERLALDRDELASESDPAGAGTPGPASGSNASDFDNQHDHPSDEIRELLYEQGIRLMTTKTGDMSNRSETTMERYRAINLKANSTDISVSMRLQG